MEEERIRRRQHITMSVAITEDALSFARCMVSEGRLDEQALLHFLEKPWKWADEFHAWIGAGKPSDEGDEPEYQRFADALEAL